MKLATGARDADILRALAMFGLLIPGIISLFVFNPVNRDPTPWHSYVSLTALISAGVIFTLVSIRSRLTRKAVMAEALRIDETLPVDEVKGIAHDQAEEAANRVLNYIETRDAQQENTRQDLETERKREES
jgi:ADP-ribose pyrophosphatase YjhB (NUDIX family)